MRLKCLNTNCCNDQLRRWWDAATMVRLPYPMQVACGVPAILVENDYVHVMQNQLFSCHGLGMSSNAASLKDA
jgi:hypothetical protein